MENNQQAQLPNRKPFNRQDFFSGLGDLISVAGSVLGLTVRWAGPVTAFVGATITTGSNYSANNLKRIENNQLKAQLTNLIAANPNIPNNNIEPVNFEDCYGLNPTPLSNFLNALINAPALLSSGLAFYYNGEKEKTGQDMQAYLIAAVALSLITPIAEKISQHYKQDNLERQKLLYKNRIQFFQLAVNNQQHQQPDANDAPENQNLHAAQM